MRHSLTTVLGVAGSGLFLVQLPAPCSHLAPTLLTGYPFFRGGHGDPEKEDELPKLTQHEPNSAQGHLVVQTGHRHPLLRPVPARHDMDRILGTISHLFSSPHRVWRNSDKFEVKPVSLNFGCQAPNAGLYTDLIFVFLSLCHCPGARIPRFEDQPSSDLAQGQRQTSNDLG